MGYSCGGIFLAGSGTTLTLKNLTLEDGQAPFGGAIFADGTDLEIDDCLFLNNYAQDITTFHGGKGGAIYINSAGTVDIINSTFTGNTAVTGLYAPTGSVGGAIADMNNSATLKITNCTIADNAAGAGGGYAAMVMPAVKGTIFDANTPQNCATVGINDKGYNIDSGNSCLVNTGVGSLKNTDALLEPLANNGGPTDTFALETSPMMSPAINLIPVASCTDQQMTPQPLGTDQRLFGRPDPANLSTCDAGAYELDAVGPYTLNSERVQIARGSAMNTDQVNIGATFTSNGDPACDMDEDALNSGFSLALIEGTCAMLPDSGLDLMLSRFVVHTVNHQSYGTLFQSSPPNMLQQSTETVSARLVALPTPAGACGEWTLNLEVAGLNTKYLGLGGTNPFALILTDSLGDGAGCFDINNAVVGNQLPAPTRAVRRGVRR